jgi:hypothetical protein
LRKLSIDMTQHITQEQATSLAAQLNEDEFYEMHLCNAAIQHYIDSIDTSQERVEKSGESVQVTQPVGEWRTIESAPKDKSLLLYRNRFTPIYVGKKRYGNLGEHQQDVFAWRCDSSGRVADPKYWMPLPPTC